MKPAPAKREEKREGGRKSRVPRQTPWGVFNVVCFVRLEGINPTIANSEWHWCHQGWFNHQQIEIFMGFNKILQPWKDTGISKDALPGNPQVWGVFNCYACTGGYWFPKIWRLSTGNLAPNVITHREGFVNMKMLGPQNIKFPSHPTIYLFSCPMPAVESHPSTVKSDLYQ